MDRPQTATITPVIKDIEGNLFVDATAEEIRNEAQKKLTFWEQYSEHQPLFHYAEGRKNYWSHLLNQLT